VNDTSPYIRRFLLLAECYIVAGKLEAAKRAVRVAARIAFAHDNERLYRACQNVMFHVNQL